MKNLIKIILLYLGLGLSAAQAQTTLPWGLATGANPRAPQIRDTSGTWISVGSLDSTAHSLIGFGVAGGTIYSGNFAAGTPASPGVSCKNASNALITCTAAQLGAQLGAGSVLLSAIATQAANTVVANTTASTASPTAVTINGGSSCTTPQFLQYTNGTGFGCANGSLPTQSANSLVGNPTGSTASPTAIPINGGAACATALTYATGSPGTIGCSAGAVSSISPGSFSTVGTNANPITSTGTLYTTGNTTPSGLRLTAVSGDPAGASTVSGATSIFLSPYNSGLIVLNTSGIGDVVEQCSEMSNVLANSSTGNAGPAAVVASGVYDLFAWNSGTYSSPVCTLTRGPAWTNSTTRSAGTALTAHNVSGGVLRNNIAITNGPGAGVGTYVGTFVADSGAGTVSWTKGGAASGGTAALLDIWNMYNRINQVGQVIDTGVNYTYASATVRQARASTGNQINLVTGLQEDGITVAYGCGVTTAATLGADFLCAIGLNNATSVSGPYYLQNTMAAVTDSSNGAVVNYFNIAIGVTFITALESSPNATTNTYDVGALNTLFGQIRM